MNETDFYTNNFFLVEHTAQLLYDDSNHNIKEVRRIRLIYDHRSCIMYLDERFNDLEFRGFGGRLSPIPQVRYFLKIEKIN